MPDQSKIRTYLYLTFYFSFQGSVHNYYALNDPLHFVRKVSDLLVGTKINDDDMEGYPWKWNGIDWIELDTYNIETDLTPIAV